jgi:UDP-N-acetylglucosamine acyltransferase
MTEIEVEVLRERRTGPPEVHATAVVDPDVELADGVRVGPYAVIEGDVHIGAGTQIDSHVRIYSGTRIGRDNRIFNGALLGGEPQDLKYSGAPTRLEIGDRNLIREFSTLHRGSDSSGLTRVGDDCFIMAYAHVAHDCVVGNHVVLANSVNMAGHVAIEDWVMIGGVVPVHQFVRIGCHSMIGGGLRVPQDVCPYALMGGYPLSVAGVNVIGLRRRGFTKAQIKPLREAFRLLFRSGINTTQALERIGAEVESTTEVQYLLDFIRASERGITK